MVTVVFVPGCIVAAWWQATRAMSGNTLSYLYSVEWPIFAILGVYFWWVLIHTDYESVGAKAQAKAQANASKTHVGHKQETSQLGGSEAIASTREMEFDARTLDELDPELAAYNERLAALAERGPKTWRTPELQVVRRT